MLARVTLTGELARLEPLDDRHVDGLAAAASENRELYRWTVVPEGRAGTERYVREALEGWQAGHMLPFAIVRLADDCVVGSTRFWDIQRWSWPPGHEHHGRETPDVCDVGFTWHASSAIRTGVNLDAKRQLFAYAFEEWRVHRVRLRTDERNLRSRRALERLGATLDGIVRADRMAQVDDTVRNTAYYSITAEEWPAVKEGLAKLARAGRALPYS